MEEDVDLMDFAWFNIELVEEKSQNCFFLTMIPKLEGGNSHAFVVNFRLTKNDCLNILKEIEEYEDDFRVAEMLLKSKNESVKEIDYYSR